MEALQLTYRQRFRKERLLRKFINQGRPLKLVWDTDNFQKQNDFVNSKATRIIAQCTRRAGKSYGVGKKLFKEASENPNVNVLYIALTRSNAKRILYKDILKEISREKNIKCKFNGSDLTVTLDNGSIIYLVGADSTEKEMHKLLGSKYKLVVIDEAAFFKQDLEYLVEEIIDAAVTDLLGQIVMISTPSANVHTYFFKCATGQIKGWQVHKWTAYENPKMAKNWDIKIKEKIARDPNVVNTPSFKRMNLNQWVVDDSLQVYKFSAQNIIKRLPELPKGGKWRFGLGIDLGWEDETAFTVVCWHQYSKVLYIPFKYKKSHMDLFEVAEYIKVLETVYGKFLFKVIDNAAKQSVETMKIRFKLNLIPAKKAGKKDHIEIMNTEIGAGNVQVVAKGDQGEYKLGKEVEDGLINEWVTLIWNEEKKKKGIFEEDESCPNHLSDSTLYAWREAYPYLAREMPEEYSYDSETAIDKAIEEEERQMMMEEKEEADIYDPDSYGEVI